MRQMLSSEPWRQFKVMRNQISITIDEGRIVARIGKIEQMAVILFERIVHAASQGSLTPDILMVLEERWVRLDEILDYRERVVGIILDPAS